MSEENMNRVLLTIAASALIGCASSAKTQVFVMPNKGGGEITLTARPCVINGETVDGLREAYTWSPASAHQQACWTIVDGMVHVLYLRSRDRMVYPIENFQRKQ
jgi:hypothetical protein